MGKIGVEIMTTRSAVDVSGHGAGLARIGHIDTSSWISWLCYAAGLKLALSPAVLADLKDSNLGVAVLLGAVVSFFVAVMLIQRHMRLSLLSRSFGAPSELITSGPFSLTRNPIYLAFLIPIASLAYFAPAVAAGTAVLYVVLMSLLVIRREEAELGRRFPEAFADYCRRVPRWIGVL